MVASPQHSHYPKCPTCGFDRNQYTSATKRRKTTVSTSPKKTPKKTPNTAPIEPSDVSIDLSDDAVKKRMLDAKKKRLKEEAKKADEVLTPKKVKEFQISLIRKAFYKKTDADVWARTLFTQLGGLEALFSVKPAKLLSLRAKGNKKLPPKLAKRLYTLFREPHPVKK